MIRLRQSPTDPGFVQNPYSFYDKARAAGDLFHWDDYGMPAAVSHRAVQTVLKDRRMGRTPLNPPERPPHLDPFNAVEAHSMLELEAPRHTRLRGLVLRAFTSRRIAALAPEITALSHTLIDAFLDAPFDLLPAFAQKLPVIVIARLLGVPDTLSDQLLSWSNAMVAMYQARRSPEIERAAAAAARDFSDFLRAYVDERRSRPADDLITHLIAAEQDGARLSADELVSTCILLLNAGHEATVHTIGNGTKALLDAGTTAALTSNPERTVEEILRFDPPLHMFTRHVYEDLDLFGHSLPRGTEIACLLAAANRDPSVWPGPQLFDPTRTPTANSSFGAGLHFCVGAPLARLELTLGLRALFERCPGLKCTARSAYGDTYHFHGLTSLMVETR